MTKECQKLRPDGTYDGKQGFSYFEGVAKETTGSSAICMHLLEVPPGGRAKAHKHDTHETAIYAFEGEVVMYWGDRLEHRMVMTESWLVSIFSVPIPSCQRPCHTLAVGRKAMQ